MLDPITLSEQSRGRNRVFRQESGTGNFGLNSVNTNFPPIYPIYNVDNQLQNLLIQSGIGGGRSNEDLNIISKVTFNLIRLDQFYYREINPGMICFISP